MLIPKDVNQFDSQGERILFHKFKKDTRFDSIFILHSVFIAKHLRSVSGEIDFLVLYPGKGIFALELKHGRVERVDGVWYYTNRRSEKNPSTKGPFRQVNDSMHSIRNWILENCDKNKKEDIRKFLFGTGVILSGIEEMIDIGSEGYQWQILYRDFISSNRVFEYLENLNMGWHNERRKEPWYNSQKSKPSYEDCYYLVKLLRGDFSREYTMLNKLRDNTNYITDLTEKQLLAYTHIFYNDRNLIEGAAGTGKTILAYQLALEFINKGLSVGFLCFNKYLGRKMISDFEAITHSSSSFIGHYHSFLQTYTTHKSSNQLDNRFYKEELPFEFLLQNENAEKFDYLILDETQDLINETNLLVFDHILEGGLAGGRWTFFGDFEKQNLYEDDSNVKLLDQFSFSKYKPLTINCRNTKYIMDQNTLMTGVHYESCLNDMLNEKVTIKFPIPSKQINQLDTFLDGLFEDQISPDKIAILFPFREYKNSLLSLSKHKDLMGNGSLIMSTIHSYKGLENDFIIIVGFDELQSQKVKQLLYIGISRATFKLFLIFTKSLESDFARLCAFK